MHTTTTTTATALHHSPVHQSLRLKSTALKLLGKEVRQRGHTPMNTSKGGHAETHIHTHLRWSTEVVFDSLL